MAPLGHENIRRFDVAVDDAFGVSSIQCVRDLDGHSSESTQFPSVGQQCDALASARPEIPWR